MKVLVITLNAWNDSGSTGNTISNVFSDSNEIEFANIYCRNEAINNKLCHSYYQITEGQILRGVLGKEVGRAFESITPQEETLDDNNPLSGNWLGNLLRRFKPYSLLFLREFVWKIPVWKNSKIEKWLLEFNPDIIYMHGHNNLYMHTLMEYCASVTNAKTVLFFGDDMYGRKSTLPIGYFYETLYRRRMTRSISHASLLFGGSLKLCSEYQEIFGKEFVPMFKQCNLSNLTEKKDVNKPITIVYAGNLLFGREKMMCDLVHIIRKINYEKKEKTLQLIVFSNTMPTKSSLLILDDKENSFFMGKRPYEDVCKALNDSDLTLFIESFSKKRIKETRLSFSTKIIDCLQSNTAMLAIAPRELASMEYIMDNNIGICATSMEDAYEVLHSISRHPEEILKSAHAKLEFALKRHSNTSAIYVNRIKNLL